MRKNKIVYLSREEQLKESLKYVSARFLMLSQLLPTNIRLNEEERRVCEDTFVLENNERIEFKR